MVKESAGAVLAVAGVIRVIYLCEFLLRFSFNLFGCPVGVRYLNKRLNKIAVGRCALSSVLHIIEISEKLFQQRRALAYFTICI